MIRALLEQAALPWCPEDLDVWRECEQREVTSEPSHEGRVRMLFLHEKETWETKP